MYIKNKLIGPSSHAAKHQTISSNITTDLKGEKTSVLLPLDFQSQCNPAATGHFYTLKWAYFPTEFTYMGNRTCWQKQKMLFIKRTQTIHRHQVFIMICVTLVWTGGKFPHVSSQDRSPLGESLNKSWIKSIMITDHRV